VSFNDEIRQFVLSHPAINNDFLARFSRAQISDAEFLDFAKEFFHFSRTFPAILANLLVNTADEKEAFELTKVLASELGDGDPNMRHELLFRRFLRSVGIAPEKVVNAPMKPTTRRFIDGLRELYGGRNHSRALGASFGLENMAIPMWDQLIPGLKRFKQTKIPQRDSEYFTFHREIEGRHEDAMEEVSSGLDDAAAVQKSFKKGASEALDLLHRFWVGLERN
jgi:pyrroloquinoline quinone (PQQ) biosynthesis protein C